MNWRTGLFLLLWLVLLVSPLWAQDLVSSVTRDFRPLAGVVIMATGGEYLIDLDATRGVREGDMFAVVKPGERIVHPTSGEVLGHIDQVKGYLQVNRVRSGYAYARPLGEGGSFDRGDKIRRFEHLDARFFDYAGAGEAIYENLKQALPALRWVGYAADQTARPEPLKSFKSPTPSLVFVHLQGQLEARDGDMTLLASYPLQASKLPAAPIIPSVRAGSSAPGPVAKAESGVVAAAPPAGAQGIVQVDRQEDADLWHGPQMKGEPVGVAVGDFDGDGKQEAVIAFENRLEIVRLSGRAWQPVTKVDLDSRLKSLALDAIDLTGDGIPELYVTAADGPQLSSVVVEKIAGKFLISIEKLPWLLRVVDLPGRGKVLLGQDMAAKKVEFGPEIFEVQRQGAALIRGRSLDLPRSNDIYGFLPFQPEVGGELALRFGRNSRLEVADRTGEILWQGAEAMGGREAYVERIDPEVLRDQMTKRLYLDAPLKPGRSGEFLVPVNEGISFLGNYRSFEKSQIKAFRWDGRAMEELWFTKPQGGYLSDFTLADVDNDGAQELVMTVLFTHAGFMSKARSNLVVYELP